MTGLQNIQATFGFEIISQKETKNIRFSGGIMITVKIRSIMYLYSTIT